MKARECPHCHKKISIRKCTIFFLRGTAYSIQCNHCNRTVSPLKEPIPMNACLIVGFFSVVAPMQFCLYYLHTSFTKALIYTLPIFLFVLVSSMILTIIKIKFK